MKLLLPWIFFLCLGIYKSLDTNPFSTQDPVSKTPAAFIATSQKVEGTLGTLNFFCQKLMIDPKLGFFLEGKVLFIDSIEDKSFYTEKAWISPEFSKIELLDSPLIVEKSTQLKASKILYTKTAAGYETFIEGPIECIVDQLNLKDYVPFEREKPL